MAECDGCGKEKQLFQVLDGNELIRLCKECYKKTPEYKEEVRR